MCFGSNLHGPGARRAARSTWGQALCAVCGPGARARASAARCPRPRRKPHGHRALHGPGARSSGALTVAPAHAVPHGRALRVVRVAGAPSSAERHRTRRPTRQSKGYPKSKKESSCRVNRCAWHGENGNLGFVRQQQCHPGAQPA